MTLHSKGILFMAPLVLLLGACSSGGDTGKTGDSNGGDSNGGDSNGGDSNGDSGGDTNGGAETGTAIANLYGHFLVGGGALTGGEFGISAIKATSMTGVFSDLEVLCTLAGGVTEGPPPPPCAACDWSFNVVEAGSVVSGTTCGDLPWSDGDIEGWEDALGMAEHYQGTYTYDNVLFYYFPSPYYNWYPIGFSYAGNAYGAYTDGDASDFTFHLPTSYYYYFYP